VFSEVLLLKWTHEMSTSLRLPLLFDKIAFGCKFLVDLFELGFDGECWKHMFKTKEVVRQARFCTEKCYYVDLFTHGYLGSVF